MNVSPKESYEILSSTVLTALAELVEAAVLTATAKSSETEVLRKQLAKNYQLALSKEELEKYLRNLLDTIASSPEGRARISLALKACAKVATLGNFS